MEAVCVSNTKIVVLGAFLICLSVLFQLIPVVFSEAFVLATILSGVPIYIIARLKVKIGVAAYIVAAIIIMLVSVHEGVFFICTNGAIGLSLGICHNHTNKKIIIYSISSVALTAALSVMNFIIGIPIFGFKLPVATLIEIGIILVFSFLYSIFYFFIIRLLVKLLNKRCKLNI